MKNTSRYTGRKKKRKKNLSLVVAASCIGIFMGAVLTGMLVIMFFTKHYLKGTIIHGIDCSFLTKEEAAKKIQNFLAQKQIVLAFQDEQYNLTGEDLGLSIVTEEELQFILDNQLKTETHTYTLQDSIAVTGKLEETLGNIKELQVSQMVEPQDAFIQQEEDGTLTIQSEVFGTMIDFEEAVQLCRDTILSGEQIVDFRPITARNPEIMQDDPALTSEVAFINQFLDTEVHYQLVDGTEFVLDRTITKEWVKQDEDGHFMLDLTPVDSFIEELSKKVSQTKTGGMFKPSEMEKEIELPGQFAPKLDIEKETLQLLSELKSFGQYTREPIYQEFLNLEIGASYVEVDLTRQRIWFYYNGELLVTSDCVSGNVSKGHSTPPGVFYLTYKKRSTYLKGYYPDGTLEYSTYVDYWMPFNGGVGLHDANWRKSFGGNIYKTNGSHGCVNLPHKTAEIIYKHIDKTMPIIVYAS